MTQSSPILCLRNLTRSYKQPEGELEILKGVNLSIYPGEMVALLGPSGSGKSTLLHICGLLDHPTKGSITIDSQECSQLNDLSRTEIRRKQLGFVYQFHHLLSDLTALENVMLPQMINHVPKDDAKTKASLLLKSMGLEKRISHTPNKLSGGEQQRVAIVRALANDPVLLLADEPTGNLDNQTGLLVFDEMLKLVKEQKLAALIATHNEELARKMSRIVYLHDGVLKEEV